MNQAKITFQLGDLSFVGEGSETWVRAQLEFVLSKIPQMAVRAASPAPSVEREIDRLTNKEVGSSYIKSKGGESNQVTRFLATADWLRLRGEKTLKTTLVSKALREKRWLRDQGQSQSPWRLDLSHSWNALLQSDRGGRDVLQRERS